MSHLRESRVEKFNQILDNVQNITNNLYTVELGETDDSAFEGLFTGIISFLYEGEDYERKDFQNDSIKKRIIKLASDLWNRGVKPSEF